MSVQTNRDDCYFCTDPAAGNLETHHVVPKRYNGSERNENLVDVCPTCHRKLESLYDERFYTVLDVSDAAPRRGELIIGALDELRTIFLDQPYSNIQQSTHELLSDAIFRIADNYGVRDEMCDICEQYIGELHEQTEDGIKCLHCGAHQ